MQWDSSPLSMLLIFVVPHTPDFFFKNPNVAVCNENFFFS